MDHQHPTDLIRWQSLKLSTYPCTATMSHCYTLSSWVIVPTLTISITDVTEVHISVRPPRHGWMVFTVRLVEKYPTREIRSAPRSPPVKKSPQRIHGAFQGIIHSAEQAQGQPLFIDSSAGDTRSRRYILAQVTKGWLVTFKTSSSPSICRHPASLRVTLRRCHSQPFNISSHNSGLDRVST